MNSVIGNGERVLMSANKRTVFIERSDVHPYSMMINGNTAIVYSGSSTVFASSSTVYARSSIVFTCSMLVLSYINTIYCNPCVPNGYNGVPNDYIGVPNGYSGVPNDYNGVPNGCSGVPNDYMNIGHGYCNIMSIKMYQLLMKTYTE